jgi:hypothetical protein
MADERHMRRVTADQYRQRAKLVRYTAEAVRSALLRHDLLDIANEYERLAENTERDVNTP